MAHAINGYAGACKNIHGHSYELHVTVSGKHADDTSVSYTHLDVYKRQVYINMTRFQVIA